MHIRDCLKLRFVRFLIAGSIAFVVDATVLTSLTGLADWPPTTARCVSFPCAVTVNWLVHRTHVFEATTRAHSEYVRFFSVQIVSACINLGIYFTAVASIAAMARWPVIALAIGSAAAMFSTYFLNSRYVFVQR